MLTVNSLRKKIKYLWVLSVFGQIWSGIWKAANRGVPFILLDADWLFFPERENGTLLLLASNANIVSTVCINVY